MKLTIEPTDRIEKIEGVECRRWEGTTETGVPVHAWVRCLSPQTHDEEALKVFDAELQALPPATLALFDIRFAT